MIGLRIEDLRDFTSRLFVGDTFDGWLLREAVITTFNTFTIDGRIRQGYYTDEELEENRIEDWSAWKTVRPFCFSLIKGKKLPESFQITLQLSPRNAERFLDFAQVGVRPEQVAGLYLNIRYEKGTLRCVTGMSLKVFTLDRQAEREWDEAVRRYFRSLRIAFTE